MACLSFDVLSISGVVIEQVDRRVRGGVETRLNIFQIQIDFWEKVSFARLDKVVAKVVEHVGVVLNIAVISIAFFKVLV